MSSHCRSQITSTQQCLQRELAAHQRRGLQIYLGIQVINPVKREVPADLQNTAFDDPLFISRFHALIDALGPALSGAEKYLSIGNEVDSYLSANPAQWVTYQTFYEEAVSYVHRQQPAIKEFLSCQHCRDQRDEMSRADLAPARLRSHQSSLWS